jgi:3-methyl-2-oxobutanoate hydroxymethyltransferase
MDLETIKSMKGQAPIVVLTCYDFNTAKILEQWVEIILVGDSLGNVVYGYDSTKQVTMEDMVKHTSAVRRGAITSFIVADMTYKSDTTKELAIENAHSLLEAGADAVKIEGKPEICKALVEKGVPVMGHVGLLPQTAEEYKVTGKDEKEADEIIKQAIELNNVGCFAIVLESIPMDLAKGITNAIKVPTIGIGAGPYCDGQVLVINDILGIDQSFNPKFVKKYANLDSVIGKAVRAYAKDVKNRHFPDIKHSFK